jgi:hypothetical protein
LLRGASGVTLTTAGNDLGNIAANTSGPISITNAANDSLTIIATGLTDDLGSVTGMTTSGSNGITLSESAGTGNINVNANISSSLV